LIGFDALCSEEMSLRVSPLLAVQRQELRQSGTLGALRKNLLRGGLFGHRDSGVIKEFAWNLKN
jgi:hypothetical protein